MNECLSTWWRSIRCLLDDKHALGPIILGVGLVWGLVGCDRTGEPYTNRRGSSDAIALELKLPSQVVVQPSSEELLDKPLAAGADLVWALSQSKSGRQLAANLLANWNSSPGALPQLLTPMIRDELAGNVQLDILKTLADWLPEQVDAVLKNPAAVSELLENAVRARINENLADRLKLPASLHFNLDFFQDPYAVKAAVAPTGFALATLAEKWSLVFAFPRLWLQQAHEGDQVTAIQLVEVLRTLAELQYAFGLQNSSGTTGSGLTRLIAEGEGGALGAVDPDHLEGSQRYFSGEFSMNLPKDLDLMTMLDASARETINSRQQPISLDEQSKLWTMGALLFARLRPAERGAIASLFEDGGGLLPDNIYGLALVTLVSMGALLDGPFIDSESRAIYAYARLDGHDGVNLPPTADLITLARLARALSLWLTELAKVDDLTHFPSALASLEAAKPKLLKALQLVSQKLLTQAPAWSSLSLAHRSEVLASLFLSNRLHLGSVFLTDVLTTNLSQFFEDAILLKETLAISPQDLLWLSHLCDEMAGASSASLSALATQFMVVLRKVNDEGFK